MRRDEDADNYMLELTEEEAREFFDRNTRHRLGISGEEFLRRWDAGEYDDPDDRSKNPPEVMEVGFLISLIRPSRTFDEVAEGGREKSEVADRRTAMTTARASSVGSSRDWKRSTVGICSRC